MAKTAKTEKKEKKKGFRLFRYFKEMGAELKKLTWPTKKELASHTLAVIVFVIVVTVVVWVLDLVFSQGVSLLAGI